MSKFWNQLMPSAKCSEDQILEWMKTGNPHHEQRTLDCLYQLLFEKAKGWVVRHGGSEEDAQDALTEALIGFVKSFRAEKYNHDDKLLHYVFSIVKFKFYDICRQHKRNRSGGRELSLEEIFPGGIPPGIAWEDPFEILEKNAEETTRLRLMEKYFNLLSAGCKERLTRYWYLHQKHEEIAAAMKDASINVSKVMKNKCEKKLKEHILNHPVQS